MKNIRNSMQGQRQVTQQQLISRMANDLKRIFQLVYIQNNRLFFQADNVLSSVSIDLAYKAFLMCPSYEAYMQQIVPSMLLSAKDIKKKTDPSFIMPVLLSTDEYKKIGNKKIIKDDLFVDLSLCYVSHYTTPPPFLQTNDTVATLNLKKIALNNLDQNTDAPLVENRSFKGIYGFNCDDPSATALILQKSFQEKIIKRLGHKYIFAKPSFFMLLIAQFGSENINTIRNIIKQAHDEEITCKNIYLYENEVYSIIPNNAE